MYSVRAELLRRMLNKTQEIDLETLAGIYSCKIVTLRGVLVCFNLPVLECRDFRFRHVLRKQIERFDSLVYTFKYSEFNKDVMLSQCKMFKNTCPELFEYCDFYFGDSDVYLNHVLPRFIEHLELIEKELKSNLVGLNHTMFIKQPDENFINKIKFYKEYLGGSLNLVNLLTFLDGIDQRAFLMDFCKFMCKNSELWESTQSDAIKSYVCSKQVKLSGHFSKIYS